MTKKTQTKHQNQLKPSKKLKTTNNNKKIQQPTGVKKKAKLCSDATNTCKK